MADHLEAEAGGDAEKTVTQSEDQPKQQQLHPRKETTEEITPLSNGVDNVALDSVSNNNDDDERMKTSTDAIIPDDELDGRAPVTAEDGLDEVDRASLWSLYMVRDFRYYFQHPYTRLLFAYLVTLCNFLIYAEDPVAHSEQECFIPVVGNCFSFVFTKYPPNGWAVLKVFLWLCAIVTGVVVGKLLVHGLVFNRLFRLKMFSGDQGSWMTMFFTSILSLFIFSWLYNGFLHLGGDAMRPYHISEKMGIRNSWFMKAAACGTWCGDFFTAWMVTDMMLQEQLYPKWARPVRAWWNRNYHRIILFWVVVVVTSAVVVTVIATDWISWDTLNKDLVHSNELSRGMLASFILTMDLLIIMQDWDFPHFINNLDIKLPGVNKAQIVIEIPQCLRPEMWSIHITGKWFNYGILFFVMILDLNMWKNQIFYSPPDYSQYTDERGRIHSLKDEYSLENLTNATYLNYEWRSTNINPETNETYITTDVDMNSRYNGYSLGLKSLAFVPSILAFLCFAVLIWYFGRWKPSEKDHYAGRMIRKRKPRRIFSRRSKSLTPMAAEASLGKPGEAEPGAMGDAVETDGGVGGETREPDAAGDRVSGGDEQLTTVC